MTTIDELFSLVAAENLQWHGLYQIAPPAGGWGVRLLDKQINGLSFFGVAQELTLELAILTAIERAKAWRSWEPSRVQPTSKHTHIDISLEDLGL